LARGGFASEDEEPPAGADQEILGLRLFVRGEPITVKQGPSKGGLKQWKLQLHSALDGGPKISETCRVRLTFLLPATSFQQENLENRNAGDLDNLSGIVLDALGGTILDQVGGDGAVFELHATKRRVVGHENPGVWITVTPNRLLGKVAERTAPPE